MTNSCPRLTPFLQRACAVFVFPVVVATSAAHEDPLGDIYPNVKVEQGNFVIYFENNENQEAQSHSFVRMIYSADGKVLAARHNWIAPHSLGDTMGDAAKSEVTLGKEKLVFSGAKGEPTYSLETNGRRELHSLSWPNDSHCAFEAAAGDADSICVACIGKQRELSLILFSRHTFSRPETVIVGKPTQIQFIYDFPVVSNLVQIGRRYCIAWVRSDSAGEKFETVISTWRSGEKQARDIVLDEPSDWNTHLSIAAIGNRLCVAYHGFGDDNFPRSRIITAFRTIRDD